MFNNGDTVTFSGKDGVYFTGDFIREERNPDDRPNGIALVTVTHKGNSFHRVGASLHVGVCRLARPVTADTLNDTMEFDHVIHVHADGTVTDAPDNVRAPELHDGELHQGNPVVGTGGNWSLMDGYSGQDGYSGPCMHASESVGGQMARDILSEPGYYVTLVNYTSDDDEPEEWAVARRDA